MLPKYSRVRLITDAYAKDGVREGALGYVIEVYSEDGKYEVEFSNPETGIAFAQVVIAHDDVIESPEPGVRTRESGEHG